MLNFCQCINLLSKLIKKGIKAYDFSKAFILGHMESFKSKKCGKAAKESLNIK